MSVLALQNVFLDAGLKPSSSKAYATTLVKLIRLLNDSQIKALDGPTKDWFRLSEFEEVFENLKSTTLKSYISAVISWMKIKGEQDTKLYRELSAYRDGHHQGYKDIVATGKKTETEEKNWVPAETLASIFDEKLMFHLTNYPLYVGSKKKPASSTGLDSRSVKQLRDIVLTSYYLYPFSDPEENFGPPRNYICSLLYLNIGRKKSFNYEKNQNYFISTGATQGFILLGDHKTFKAVGEERIPIPAMLADMLLRWSKFLGLTAHQPLFEDVSRHDVTIILRRQLKQFSGIAIGSQLLRKIYKTSRFSKDKKNREEVAKSMSHSQAMGDSVYTKTD